MKKAHLCEQCGICCTLFYINLNEVEYNSGNFRTMFNDSSKTLSYDRAAECGANFLNKKEKGECIYLKNNSCSIHQDRPQVCRAFFCKSNEKEFEKMRRLVVEHKGSLGKAANV